MQEIEQKEMRDLNRRRDAVGYGNSTVQSRNAGHFTGLEPSLLAKYIERPSRFPNCYPPPDLTGFF